MKICLPWDRAQFVTAVSLASPICVAVAGAPLILSGKYAPLASWLGMQILLVFPVARIASMHACATGYHWSARVVGSFWIPNHTFGLPMKIVASLPHRSANTVPFSWEFVGVM